MRQRALGSSGLTVSEIAELPMWTIFIAWPVTGVTWLVFLGESFLGHLRVLRHGANA